LKFDVRAGSKGESVAVDAADGDSLCAARAVLDLLVFLCIAFRDKSMTTGAATGTSIGLDSPMLGVVMNAVVEEAEPKALVGLA